MTPRERAKQAILRSAIPPHFSQWWAITISPEQIEALTHTIESAIKAAIEEEREACAQVAAMEGALALSVQEPKVEATARRIEKRILARSS